MATAMELIDDNCGDAPRLRLLGGCELDVAGAPPESAGWRRPKPRSLIKLLALQPRRAAHRECVIETLWPGVSAEAGANNLNQLIHMLRDVLPGRGIIERRDDMLVLAPALWVDVEAFRVAAQEALDSDTVAAYERALALYRGELLPEDRYEEWTERARDELAALHLQLLSAVAARHEGAGEWTHAEGRLRDLIACDPLDDGPHLRLARVLVAAHQPRRALSECRAYRAVLQRELDVEPSDELAALEAELAGQLEARDAARARVPLDVRYATSRDGTRIAYAMHEGGGGIPLVVMPVLPWGHLQVEWETPPWRDWIERMSRGRTLIRYNLRGTGISQLMVEDISLDRQVEDLSAVVDAARLRRLALLVIEGAGPIGLTYAARERDRVRALILYYAWADGAAYAAAMGGAGARQLMLANWDVYLGLMGRGACAWDNGAADQMVYWLKASGTQEMVLRYWDMITTADATACIGDIRSHSIALWKPNVTGFISETFTPAARTVVEAIGASELEIDGAAYNFVVGDTEPMAAAIDEFLDEPAPRRNSRAHDRVIAPSA